MSIKSKTPIQELIEHLTDLEEMENIVVRAIIMSIKKLIEDEYLSKEKEHLIRAVKTSNPNQHGFVDGEIWYKLKYGKP